MENKSVYIFEKTIQLNYLVSSFFNDQHFMEFYRFSNYFIFILVSSVRAGLIFELITTNENFRSEGFSIERFKVPMEEERSFKRRGGNRITPFQNF